MSGGNDVGGFGPRGTHLNRVVAFRSLNRQIKHLAQVQFQRFESNIVCGRPPAVWSVDNRTAGYRLCGEGTGAVRIECRIGGSDMNPYLAGAAMLAAGLAGIDEGLDLAPATVGDVYDAGDAQDIPRTLRAATESLRRSDMLRAAFGDEVVAHYTRCAEWEQEEFDRVVTDWEVARGFERA